MKPSNWLIWLLALLWVGMSVVFVYVSVKGN